LAWNWRLMFKPYFTRWNNAHYLVYHSTVKKNLDAL
jgi:hypothetical protein